MGWAKTDNERDSKDSAKLIKSLGQVVQKINLDESDLDLETLFCLSFMPVLWNNIRLDHPDPGTQFLRLPYLASKRKELAWNTNCYFLLMSF